MTNGDGTPTGDGGWRPLSGPSTTVAPPAPAAPGRRRSGRRLNVDGSVVVSPFVRLARTHAFHAAGDASYAVALVGSIFALDTDAARGRILLYLLLTLAPFALVGPFIGPALDRVRGGRRLMIVATLVIRGVLMLSLLGNIESLWLFPLAFSQLVMAKTYSVAKAATVPTTVTHEQELVDKNSRLAVLGTVAGGVGALPALGLQAIWGSTPTLIYAFLIYTLGTLLAWQLPRVTIEDPELPDEVVELRSAGVRLAASAMSVLRAISGFVFWLMVFAFGSNDVDVDGVGRAAGVAVKHALGFSIEGDDSQPAWKLGFALSAIGLGIFIGNVLAPRIRERFPEERMIVGALAAVLAAALAAMWAGGLSGAMLLGLVAGLAPASAKLAFDSLVQRDAPGANQGSVFGRFETRFQIASVIGSVFAVAPTVGIPVRVGAFIVALAALVAAVMYQLGERGVRLGRFDLPDLRQWLPWVARNEDAAAELERHADGIVGAPGRLDHLPAPPDAASPSPAPPTAGLDPMLDPMLDVAPAPTPAPAPADGAPAPTAFEQPVPEAVPPDEPTPATPAPVERPQPGAVEWVEPGSVTAQIDAVDMPEPRLDVSPDDAPPAPPIIGADPVTAPVPEAEPVADPAPTTYDDPADDPLLPPTWLDEDS